MRPATTANGATCRPAATIAFPRCPAKPVAVCEWKVGIIQVAQARHRYRSRACDGCSHCEEGCFMRLGASGPSRSALETGLDAGAVRGEIELAGAPIAERANHGVGL